MIRFTHIYAEEKILHLERTKQIIRKQSQASVIPIADYKNIFNRSNQNFQAQKSCMRLILAEKKDQFYYPGSQIADNLKHPRFYYNSLILNCMYNCEYCYLQGMYNSGHVVIFVNLEDFFRETDVLLSSGEETYLCISYDTDLLAFESLVPYASEWIRFAEKRPNLLLEIRTKSAGFSQIEHIEPIPNVILAWTLSPAAAARRYEKKTPTLRRRMESLRAAVLKGWRTRICFDPLLRIPDWKKEYSELIDSVMEVPELRNVNDITVGVFRINAKYLKNIKKMRTDSELIYYPFKRNGDIASYKKEYEQEMLEYFISHLEKYYRPENIYV